MPDAINLFEPFSRPPLGLTAPRSGIVGRLAAVLNRPTTSNFAILAGDLGEGKTTILRNILPEATVFKEYRIVYIQCAPSLNASSLISSVANALDLHDVDVLRRYGVSDSNISQDIGEVRDSTSTSQQQVVQSQELSFGWNVAIDDLGPILAAFQRVTQSPILLCLDQFEVVFQRDVLEMRTLIDGLLSAASPGCRMIFSVRSDYVSSILSFASGFHELPSSIVTVPGLNEDEARVLLAEGGKLANILLSGPLINKIIDVSRSFDGYIWPIGMNALAKKIVETAIKKGRKAVTIRDFVDVGDIVGAVRLVISDTLDVLPREDRSEAWYILREFATYAAVKPIADVQEITKIAYAYPSEQVLRVFNALESLRLIRRLPNDTYALAHDVISAAVRNDGRLADKIDRGLDLWLLGNTNYEHISGSEISDCLRKSDLPLPALLFVAEHVFRSGGAAVEKHRTALKELLNSKDAKLIAEFISWRVRRIDPRRRASAFDLFALLLDDRPKTLEMAMLIGRPKSMVADPTNPHRSAIDAALHFAAPKRLGEVLERDDVFRTLSKDTPFLSLILQYLISAQVQTSFAFIGKIFEVAENPIRAAALVLAKQVDAQHARAFAEIGIKAPNAVVRAEAISILLLIDCSESNFLLAKSDDAMVVRRRAAYCIGRHHSDRIDLLKRLYDDESPFVREAVLEVIGSERITELATLVHDGLNNEYDFVRESAAYALKDVIDLDEAASAIGALLNDASPYVREAASRILSDVGIPISPFAAIPHLRSGRSGLSTAVLRALGRSSEEDLLEVIVHHLTEIADKKEDVVLCLQVLSQIRDADALQYVEGYLMKEDPDIVEAAVVAVQNCGRESDAHSLGDLIDHQSVDVRERVVYALADLGGEEAVASLKRALWDPAPEVVSRAIYGLARLHAHDASELVRLVALDSSDVVRAREYFEHYIGGVSDGR